MRYLNGFICALLTLFAIAQYNDPDAVLWALIYGVPAVWAGLAAWRPTGLAHSPVALGALGLCLILTLAGTIYMWPADFSVWWDVEEVREDIGLMIVTTALAVVALTLWRVRRAAAAARA
jgi:hypothetical protein